MRRTVRVVAAVVAASAVLAGCSSGPRPSPSGGPPPTVSAAPEVGPVVPAGEPAVLVSGLTSPWSVVRLPSGSALISERDTAKILEYTAEGTVRTVGTVEGVHHGGEGGLLGLAVTEQDVTAAVYAYFTTATDSRIVRIALRGSAGSYTLGEANPILTGIAKAGNHNGGRIAIGPDGTLFATTGDANRPDSAQEPASLNGKILRINLDGSVPSDNPFPGSFVYTLGHRNPQGIAWDADGKLWASEFGQNTWDELNRISPGKNYGWPIVEGKGDVDGFVDPVLQWATSEASPSGLAFVHGTFFMAALRGARLWTIAPGAGSDAALQAHAWFTGEFGRLRDAVPGPDGTLWVLTNNTDGRGSPRAGDDRLLQVTLAPAEAG